MKKVNTDSALQAALIIQKRQRGVMVRRQLEDDKKARAMVHGAVKVQALVRGCQARTKVVSWKRALVLALIEKEKERLNVKSTLIQCAFRSHLAKNKFRALLLRKIKQVRTMQSRICRKQRSGAAYQTCVSCKSCVGCCLS